MSNEIASFSDFGFNDWLVSQCSAVGLSCPTEIQANCIPAILDGEVFLFKVTPRVAQTGHIILPVDMHVVSFALGSILIKLCQ